MKFFQRTSTSHWPDFHWNVSKSWLQKVDLFENYAIVAMQSDNVTFLSFKIIKVTSGFNLKKTIFFTRWRHHPKNSWNIFQIQITPLLWRSQGPQGCLEKRNCPLSLNLAVWCAKIGPKTQKFQKTINFCCFSCIFISQSYCLLYDLFYKIFPVYLFSQIIVSPALRMYDGYESFVVFF